ncbi:maleylpyruvate isomerase family mycothiol-dependent enzyme [Nocardia pneumoniae]|uniref:maleylpyruvate isomerase family mycothiol-dependent enzyme n=1 Tax=Nocardia pneumoniae TaxID=228601 RepID=UPI00031AD4F9|nr:maleylpyruvate isomerase family mycothiol-dependent enzyme [Nocardia pneumoniae]
MNTDDVVRQVKSIHERERTLIASIGEDSARANSVLPGWTRGHVLSCRLAFLRAAHRQVRHAMTGSSVDFYDGGRPGREAEIAARAHEPADRLVAELTRATSALDETWSALGPSDWDLPANYREPCTLTSVLYGSWREAEIHCVDYDLGYSPNSWSPSFCAHLFEFLTPRIPAGIQVDLIAHEGGTWKLGTGEPVEIRGALTDLAAWLSGRAPQSPVESSSGELPTLQRLRGPEPLNRA